MPKSRQRKSIKHFATTGASATLKARQAKPTDSKIVRRIIRGTHTRCHKHGLVGDYFESLNRERNLERLES